ncbi:MAG: FAD-binding oxidoreductase [bacterium]|nr:FAD-binding oxidoreductase [bacterium]
MFGAIDSLLNRVTMYRLALYYLFFLVLYASLFGFLGALPYRAQDFLILTAILMAVSWGTNKVLARIFHVNENIESSLITGLILALIINPDPALAGSSLVFWSLAGFLASISKYIFAPFRKHIFNPAAFAVAATAFTIGQPAGWWVGSFPIMLPPVFFGGLLIARKLRRGDLVLSFLVSSLILLFWKGGWTVIPQTIYYAPFFFFAFIMLTEPSTAPPRQGKRIAYGAVVGVLSILTTYELALLCGNIFSYLVSPKHRFIMKLKEQKEIASNIYEFSFAHQEKISHLPGQYFEWTLKHKNSDTRGIRRYFTIASSPTENEIRLGTKFNRQGSTFKKTLAAMRPGDKISACQLAGDFTLPADKNKKLVFIAGGIGITPFRSMIKYLIDIKEKRDIILLYSNKTESEIAYREIFEEARTKLSIKTVYINNDKDGFINDKTIMWEAPDFKERHFYISGPPSMIEAFQHTLTAIGVPRSQIKTDFFPGYV